MAAGLAENISRSQVSPRSVALWWLGQAGFAMKTPTGEVVLVDPYLSDSCQRVHGLKRLSLPPFGPDEARADWLLFTHEHTDHLEPDTVAPVAGNCPNCRLAGPAGCCEPLAALGIAPERFTLLAANAKHDFPGFSVETVPADHGASAPSALSLLLEVQGLRLLFTGDTSLRPDLLKPLLGRRIDLLVACINGGYGNMGHLDAARLVQAVRPRSALPCHFWTFAEGGAGDPWSFIQACRSLCPETTPLLLKPGEPFLLAAP